jgi:cation-transporting ATPase E
MIKQDEQFSIKGLTENEVAERISKGQVNRTNDKSSITFGKIVRKNVFTFFNMIFLILAVLLIIAGSYKNLTFLVVIVANTLIGIVQEWRAKLTLDKLSVMDQAKVTAIRDGEEKEIPVDDLVVDDVILVESGTQIPADASLIHGKVYVNESLLTGEPDEIEKNPEKGKDELRSGSFVVSGKGYALLEKVGEDSYITQLQKKARTMPKSRQSSEMVHSIDLFVKIAGILIVPIGIIMFLQSYSFQGISFAESVTSMVAAVIGMIPEGLYLLLSIALAMSAARLAQNQVILHDMHSIETLAHVDTICVDKTGTITTGEMRVSDCILPDRGNEGERKKMLGAYLQQMPDQNVTMQALRKSFRIAGSIEAENIIPFSSKNKYSELTTKDGKLRLGAPEMVLDREVFNKYEDMIGSYADKGERVLVFAGEDKEGIFKPLLFIALQDTIRKNAEKTFDFFQKNDVTLRVISGDNPRTVSRIAGSVGIKNADNYVDCSTLKDEELLRQAVREKTIFGRVSPEQKMSIIKMLKKEDHTVAMTGDGVNDILAMKEADCSIAMGNGSDAARQAAQVVLCDNDFGHMENIVYEGRRDVNNISRSATLFLVKNMFSLFLSIFSIIHVMTYPLVPSQISLISMFNIGIPAFFLAMEPNQNRPASHFLRHVILTALPAAVTDFFIIVGMVIFSRTFGISEQDVSVASTFLLAIVGFMILASISRPMNAFRVFVLILCIVGILLASEFLPDLFELREVTTKCAMLFSLFALCSVPILEYLTKFLNMLENKFETGFKRKTV